MVLICFAAAWLLAPCVCFNSRNGAIHGEALGTGASSRMASHFSDVPLPTQPCFPSPQKQFKQSKVMEIFI